MEENEIKDPEQVEDTPEQVKETAPATPATPPVSEKPIETIKSVDPNPDYEAKLAAKDAEIQRLSDAFTASKSSHHMTQGEIQKAREALAVAVTERQRIEAEKDRALAETETKLKEVSQATQTLTEERSKLAEEYETQAAKATKLEVLAEEFPELLRYSKLIPASKDPEVVRAACKALADARKQDLEAARIQAVTGNGISQIPTSPTRTDDAFLTDPEEMRSWLAEAKNDPKEYERRRQALVDRHEAAVARARAASA